MTRANLPRPKHPLSAMPSCRELGERLISYGDSPLLSGRTNFAITDFDIREDGLVCTKAKPVDESTLPASPSSKKVPRHV